MSDTDLHPHFEAAPAERRWTRDLKALWRWLEKTSEQEAPAWVGVILPHGAHVALRKVESGQRELMIYRKERFTTADGGSKWAAEVLTFARHFGVTGWEKGAQLHRGGLAEGHIHRNREAEFLLRRRCRMIVVFYVVIGMLAGIGAGAIAVVVWLWWLGGQAEKAEADLHGTQPAPVRLRVS